MAFGAIIIGDEILSGKRQDKHFPRIVASFRERGLELSWCTYVGDDRPRLARQGTRQVEVVDAVEP